MCVCVASCVIAEDLNWVNSRLGLPTDTFGNKHFVSFYVC